MGRTLVHEFNMSDVEDPEIYAAGPIYSWQQTDAGQWVMKHSNPEPEWNIGFSHDTYGYQVRIIASLTEEEQTFFHLKYGNQCK